MMPENEEAAANTVELHTGQRARIDLHSPHVRHWGKITVAMNSLALLKERAETRNRRRKSLSEIYAAMSDLRAAEKGTPPAADGAPALDDSTPEGVRRIIAEARTLATGLAAEARDMQQLQRELSKARGIARARAAVLVLIALILAPLAIFQLW